MARLTAKERKALPKSEFALPGKRFPVNDRAHAANAKARAEQGWVEGKLSASQRDKVIARANDKLHKGAKRG